MQFGRGHEPSGMVCGGRTMWSSKTESRSSAAELLSQAPVGVAPPARSGSVQAASHRIRRPNAAKTVSIPYSFSPWDRAVSGVEGARRAESRVGFARESIRPGRQAGNPPFVTAALFLDSTERSIARAHPGSGYSLAGVDPALGIGGSGGIGIPSLVSADLC